MDLLHSHTTRIDFRLPLIHLFLYLPRCICLSVYLLSLILPLIHIFNPLISTSFPSHAMPCILHSFLLASVLIKLCPICAERTGGSFKGGTDICSPLIRGSELVGDNIEWAGADLLMVTGNPIPSIFFIITFFYYYRTPSSISSFSSRSSFFFFNYTSGRP